MLNPSVFKPQYVSLLSLVITAPNGQKDQRWTGFYSSCVTQLKAEVLSDN